MVVTLVGITLQNPLKTSYLLIGVREGVERKLESKPICCSQDWFVQFLIYNGINSGVEEEGKGFEKGFGKGLASGSNTVVTSESSVATFG